MGEKRMDRALLMKVFSSAALPLDERQIEQFATFFAELLNWNKQFNLTAITEEKEVIIKHFYDSALGLKAWDWLGNEKVLDLGTGAGFPGIPLKLICPEIQLTLVDSLQKRVGFLQHMIDLLPLSGTEAIHGRAEELGKDKVYRGKFDVVVSRAVANLAVLVEYCLPFVQTGGVFLAYKGADGEEELSAAGKAIVTLGGEVTGVKTFDLPEGLGKRTIITIKKNKPTPAAFPRKPGLPGKKPIQ